MDNKSHSLSRYIHFFIHIRKISIYYRLINKIKRPLSQSIIRNQKFTINYTIDFPNDFFFDLGSDYGFDVQALLQNEFILLNQKRVFTKKVKWSQNRQSHLWNFHLNYFDYILSLSESSNLDKNDCFAKAQSFIDQWIDSSHHYDSVMWAPFTISLRLINWLKFIYVNEERLKNIPSFYNKLLSSIGRQYRYLNINLEKDIRGNHLFENLKTLICCDILFNNDKKLKKHLKLLNKELKQQLLSDGCHFEKSISYHLIVLDGLLDIIHWLHKKDIHDEILTNKANQMYSFYSYIRYGTHDYPLFNDSNYSMIDSEKIEDKWLHLSKNKLTSFVPIKSDDSKKNTSGYYVHRYKDTQLTIDGGLLGPHALTAHAHNDIFNYELVFKGTKLVVDSGVSEYQNGPMRQYSRSTRAHNTLMINNYEQSEIWGSFRNGKRPLKVESETYYENDTFTFKGRYKLPYKKILKRYKHKRILYQIKDHTLVIWDYVIGRGELNIKNFIHLHPDINIRNKKDIISLFSQNDKFDVHVINANSVNTIKGQKAPYQGWYQPEFGKNIPNSTFEISISGKSALSMGYVITDQSINNIEVSNGVMNIEYSDKLNIELEVNL